MSPESQQLPTRITETIARLDFSELGSHWLDPGRRNVHPAELSQRSECYRLLAEFVDRHQVKPFSHRYRNLQALFKQGGAGNDQVKGLLMWKFGAHSGLLGDVHGKGRPFDHVELWGRDGVPLVLIGHPYGITDEGRATLDAIRALGLVVADYHPSWYGPGTCQARVYHAPTLRRALNRARGAP